jgi:hypothetical protein
MTDTKYLKKERLGREETGALFTQNLLLIGAPEHEEEKKHLDNVISAQVIKLLSKMRTEELGYLPQYLQKHHKHPWSQIPVKPAELNVGTKYFEETKNDEIIEMTDNIQR